MRRFMLAYLVIPTDKKRGGMFSSWLIVKSFTLLVAPIYGFL